jgi:hypothetical protein
VFHYQYKYSSTQSFGDLSVYPKWKMTVKTWIQSFGLGKACIYTHEQTFAVSLSEALVHTQARA